MYYKNKIIRLNLLIVVYSIFVVTFYNHKQKHFEDDLTLVSAYYQIKSKHSNFEYLNWLKNIVLLNKSFVFFTNKKFMPKLKKLRPFKLHYKTIFVELEIEDFYVNKNFKEEFNKSFYIDPENSYHTIPLYMIWAEKNMFLKRAIFNNHFHSKCFYWIDAGYFRESKINMKKYVNSWPSTKKCYEDKRVLMGQVKNFSYFEKKKIVEFDTFTLKNLQNDINVIGGLFGGQVENILKFGEYYYEAIKEYEKKNLFIGKDQNIYTFVAFSHPEIVKLVFFPDYLFFKVYLK